jgi:hypothetical protein
MKRILTIISIIFLAPLFAGLYGILHDQLTYTISPEYYTKFKFFQFGLLNLGEKATFAIPRIQVSYVGFLATWWMGIPIGIILSLVGLIHKENKIMFRITMSSFLITIIIAFLTGIIGLIYGKIILTKIGVNWYLPDNLIDKSNFILVGSMHNFSYFGGLTGIIAGIIYSFKQKRKKLKSE